MGHYGHVRNSKDDPALNASPVAVFARRVRSGAFVERRAVGRQPFAISPVATFNAPWAMAFLPGTGVQTNAIVTEKPGGCGWSTSATGAKQPSRARPRSCCRARAGLLDVVAVAAFRGQPARLPDLCRALGQRRQRPGARPRRPRARWHGARIDGLKLLWHDPAGGEGGQFGAIVAFAPDGQSLFLSSGERQRFTPAQSASQPIGKILHLTLDGAPAPGNPWAGRVGAATVTVTDPPEDTEAAKSAPGRSFTWRGPNLTPAETWTLGHRNPYGLAFDPRGPAVGDRNGPSWRRRAQPDPAGAELRLAARVRGENYDGVPIAKPPTRPDLEQAKLWWVPSISPTSLLIYTGDLFPQWKGSGFIGTLTGEGLIRVDSKAIGRERPSNGNAASRIRFVGQGPRRCHLSARGWQKRANVAADSGSGAAITQIIRPAAFAPRLGAVAGLDPAARRLEEVGGPLGQPFELAAWRCMTISAQVR